MTYQDQPTPPARPTATMTEATVIQSLISQAPGLAGVILVIWFFLKAIEKRDQMFVAQMTAITDRLAALETRLAEHDTNSKNAYKDRSDTLDRIEKKINVIGEKTKRVAK